MMLQWVLIIGAALGSYGCAAAVHSSPSQASPREILNRAMEQAGGADALIRAPALAWDGVATVHAGGRDVEIAGTWEVQPPDSAVVTTYEVSRGPDAARALVLASPHGWLVGSGKFTPMPSSMLASERAEFYLYEVIRLVSLQDSAVRISAAAPDTLQQKGIRAEHPDGPLRFSIWIPAGASPTFECRCPRRRRES
jgi:hypothetical protein